MKKISEPRLSEKEMDSSLENDVLNFFLNLYTIQMGFTEEDKFESKIKCLDPEYPGPDHTYELSIKGKLIKSRRMALGRLGENSGSKSRCFKVIYDDILVVKITPVPITNFDEYIECINIERGIVDRLSSSIECIAPSLSAILRKNPKTPCKLDLTFEEIEDSYIQLLKRSPWLQDYLKINNAFIFFMNLSKHSFLSNVIEKMHNTKERLYEEIISQIDILWNMMAFEEIYGGHNSHIFFNISEIYTDYEEHANMLMKKYQINPSLFIYKKKEWFLLYLAGKKMNSNDQTLPNGFTDELNSIIKNIFTLQTHEISEYKIMMKNFVYEKMFNQNKAQCKGIVTNMLDLLYWLKLKGVSIRDLKPDNMFVVGGTFLQHANEFSLGLIDFETALRFRKNNNEDIEQPLLAGTPSYATPSHLAKNEILSRCLKNLSRIMYLQDWHAAVGIIFYVVTGERLFEKTRRWIAETGQTMQESSNKKMSLPDTFKKCSRLFWYSAINEFKGKIADKQDLLKSVEISLSDNVRQLFKQELLKEQKDIMANINACIKIQNFFKSKKSHRDLINSNFITISKCRKNWENGVNVPKTRQEIRKKIIDLLKILENLKLDIEERSKTIRFLEKSNIVISVYDLLEIMFNIIFNAMYKYEWGNLSDSAMIHEVKKIAGSRPPDKTISYEETVSYEDTVAFDNSNRSKGNTSHEKTISFKNTK